MVCVCVGGVIGGGAVQGAVGGWALPGSTLGFLKL